MAALFIGLERVDSGHSSTYFLLWNRSLSKRSIVNTSRDCFPRSATTTREDLVFNKCISGTGYGTAVLFPSDNRCTIFYFSFGLLGLWFPFSFGQLRGGGACEIETDLGEQDGPQMGGGYNKRTFLYCKVIGVDLICSLFKHCKVLVFLSDFSSSLNNSKLNYWNTKDFVI